MCCTDIKKLFQLVNGTFFCWLTVNSECFGAMCKYELGVLGVLGYLGVVEVVHIVWS